MTALRKIGAITAILLSTACSQPAPPPSAIEQLADEYLDDLMESDALMGTYYSIEGARHDRLPDNSLAGIAKWQAKEDAWLARLNGMGAHESREPRLGHARTAQGAAGRRRRHAHLPQ